MCSIKEAKIYRKAIVLNWILIVTGGGTKSTSSNEEVDGCDLGKSAYIANSNSPVVENSIGNDEVPYDVAKGALADEELETISC